VAEEIPRDDPERLVVSMRFIMSVGGGIEYKNMSVA